MKNFICLLTISLVMITQSLHAQWIKCSVPNTIFFSFAATPNNAEGGTNLFAGSNVSGVFLSTDDGTSWTAVNNGATFGEVRALAVMDTNLFAAAGLVFLTNNNGISWTPTALSNLDAQALAVSDTNVFAGTYLSGIYHSSNKGKSWTAVNSGLTGNALAVTGLIVSNKNLFAGTWGSGAFRSTDNGKTWTAVNNGITDHVHCFADSPNGIGGTNLFAGTFFGEGVYLSTDNGNSWTVIGSGMTNKNVRCLAISPIGAGSINLYAGTWKGGVFLSNDNGTHWTDYSTGLTSNSVVNGLFVSGSYLFAGTDDGIWRRPLSDFTTNTEQINTDHTASGFGLEQNYPNPFNSSTKIWYQILSEENVSLKVYSFLGKEVSTLVNGKKSAGNYEVEFASQSLPFGIYFYCLRAGNSIEIKKMILLK